MKKSELSFFITLSLAMLVPVPGRLAYGIILILFLNILVLTGILFKKLISFFFSGELQNVILCALMISTCVLFRQIFLILFPLQTFILGITIFMPVLTSFVLGRLYVNRNLSVAAELKASLKSSTGFSLFSILFFALRDIIGYGTLSFPSGMGITEIKLFDIASSEISFLGMFWASVPGALILIAIEILVVASINRNLNIIESLNRRGGE